MDKEFMRKLLSVLDAITYKVELASSDEDSILLLEEERRQIYSLKDELEEE